MTVLTPSSTHSAPLTWDVLSSTDLPPDLPPFGVPAAVKAPWMTQQLMHLTEHHRQHCADYARMLALIQPGSAPPTAVSEVPFLPVRVFKELELLSVPREQVFKTMTSSGTTGQQVSRIHLDKTTAALQSKVLARLMTDVLGPKRLPMLVVDSPSVLKDRQAFSARGAGILGFSLFGRDVTYALDDDMQPNWARIDAFLEKHPNQPVFIFGFTFMVWQHWVMPLQALNRRLPLAQGILLHGGGWKKLKDQAVDAATFNAEVKDRLGLDRVVNYYGMVEQTGSIYLECSHGHLHAPVFADIVVRDPVDFSPCPVRRPGLVETVSVLPRSYPGHALLTEDMGVWLGEDDCPCGRLGKYFRIEGRMPRAEVRGCSDTYATAQASAHG